MPPHLITNLTFHAKNPRAPLSVKRKTMINTEENPTSP
jgi:hypothetical protein